MKTWLPSCIAAFIGIGAAIMRAFELSSGYDASTGLPSGDSTLTVLLLVIMVLMAAFSVLSAVKLKAPAVENHTQGDAASKGHILGIALSVLILIISTVVGFSAFFDETTRVPLLVFLVVSVLSEAALIIFAVDSYKGKLTAASGFQVTVVLFWACFWLILTYLQCCTDPVIMHYLFDLLGGIMAVLSLAVLGASFYHKTHNGRLIALSLFAGFLLTAAVLGDIIYTQFIYVEPQDSMMTGEALRYLNQTLYVDWSLRLPGLGLGVLMLFLPVYGIKKGLLPSSLPAHSENEDEDTREDANGQEEE